MSKSLVYDYIVEKMTKIHMEKRHRKYGKKGVNIKYISFHNVCHKLLVPGIKLLRVIRKNKMIIINDNRKDVNIPVIYACTHIGGFDIETLFEAIKDPCYLFLADPREIYLNFDGLLLWLNGVICFESDNKSDRKIAKEKAIQLLKKKGSLMIFPEGAWNIYESLPVMPLFWGTADIAIKTNTPIVPIAIERYDKKYFVNIGEEIKPKEIYSKTILTDKLRDEMASLKWQIWEAQGSFFRCDLKDNRETFLSQIFNQKNTSVTIDDVLRCRYYPHKEEKNEKEVTKEKNVSSMASNR